MHLRLTASGLAWNDEVPPPRVVACLDSVLRGIGQVMLQDNSYAGLLFLVGILWNSPLFAIGALLGTSVSTATALLLGADRTTVRAGLYGYNGALVAIALLYFLRPDALTWGCVVLAAAGTTILQAAFARMLDTWKLPALTAPFVLVSLCAFLAAARFGRLETTQLLPTAGLPRSVAVEGIVTAATVVQGLFNGVAQVFFQGNVVTGLCFALGLLISSRLACLAALTGSLTGLLVAWGMGAAEPAIRAGAFGFNSTLVAIALAGMLVRGAASPAYTLLATIAAAFVFAALSAALEPLGMPALTFPFVLVTWCCLLASPHFGRLRT